MALFPLEKVLKGFENLSEDYFKFRILLLNTEIKQIILRQEILRSN